jgi:ParB family transcriptional regulator, chromosome partitioning protein
MIALELRQLDLRYAPLRIADPARRARLEAAIAQQGQQVPVLVVPAGGDRFVLIEGYGRVDALRRLHRDVVQAVTLEVGEADALVLRHRLEGGRQRSALEEGWLVAALLDHGKSQTDVAIALGKSTAWVSRRLALVRTLPEGAQEAVRSGRIGAHAAEKFLVPLARANAAQCATLVEGLRKVRPTVRQLARLYAAWKAADAEVRQRIAEQPLLYLKAEDAVKPVDPEEDLTALRDVEAVAGVCGRARKGLREGAYGRLPSHRRPHLDGAWQEARLAFDALAGLLAEEGLDARS